jgi:putative phosphoesterase
MRILVISDVHGNAAALDAVLRERHDAILCLGDTVGYGPRPGYCVRELQHRGAWAVQGNHDRAAAYGVTPGVQPEFIPLAEATASFAAQQLRSSEIRYLRLRPTFRLLELDGIRYLAVHATRSDPFYRYLAADAVEWQAELERTDADVLLVGQAHRQFERRLGSKRLVNPGSVGQPRDGDPRAAYAIIEDGRLVQQRTEYRVETTVARLESAGLPPAPLAALTALLRTGRLPANDPPPDRTSGGEAATRGETLMALGRRRAGGASADLALT